ncbi:E3 ubiquitin-protein ligase [Forsythia ovata]|uniref:RING-type E3 ubiquitin transferase n=1 Tax=Forsythia ovata TaxID=205694 RepID=A0ABD1P430_9LAMI
MATSLLSSAPSSSSASVVIGYENIEDACSICLEPFDSFDPPAVTKCNHEFHLQCILEWSQRSKECPMCWQLLVLKDPSSQELLAAVENERNLRSMHNVHHIHGNIEVNHHDDCDFEDQVMQQFAATVNSARSVSRRRRQITSSVCPSQGLPSVSMENVPTTSSMILPSLYAPTNVGENTQGPIKQSQPLSDSTRRSSSSELLAFSVSLKSKFSTASARYKESISKSTRDLKEKLIAHNDSVKELSKGVQREMGAGIAGISRMIERLDFTSKQAKVSVPLSSYAAGTSNSPHEGEGDTNVHSINQNTGETKNHMKSVPYPISLQQLPRMHRSFSCRE